MFHLARPDDLWFLVVVLVLYKVAIMRAAVLKIRLTHIFSQQWTLLPWTYVSPRGYMIEAACQMLIIGLLALAASQPLWKRTITAAKMMPVRTLLIFDTSQSVLARLEGPESPTRLDMAKKQIVAFLAEYQSKTMPREFGNDEIGLIIFAGEASVISPVLPVAKHGHLSDLVREIGRIDEYAVRQFPQGTDIGKALLLVEPAFGKPQQAGQTAEIVILITDGELEGDLSVLRATVEQGIAVLARRPGLAFYVVGLGDASRGAFVPVRDEEGRVKFLIRPDLKGPVVTKPDFDLLWRLARNLDGTFFPARTGEELHMALRDALHKERMRSSAFEEHVVFMDLSEIIALIALVLLFLTNPIRNFVLLAFRKNRGGVDFPQ
ncbi:MAG: VWA domain-containing protein [Patescibacteria group bacterium]